jgi:hypothetical protein
LETETALNLSVIHEAKAASWVAISLLTTARRPREICFFV